MLSSIEVHGTIKRCRSTGAAILLLFPHTNNKKMKNTTASWIFNKSLHYCEYNQSHGPDNHISYSIFLNKCLLAYWSRNFININIFRTKIEPLNNIWAIRCACNAILGLYFDVFFTTRIQFSMRCLSVKQPVHFYIMGVTLLISSPGWPCYQHSTFSGSITHYMLIQ